MKIKRNSIILIHDEEKEGSFSRPAVLLNDKVPYKYVLRCLNFKDIIRDDVIINGKSAIELFDYCKDKNMFFNDIQNLCKNMKIDGYYKVIRSRNFFKLDEEVYYVDIKTKNETYIGKAKDVINTESSRMVGHILCQGLALIMGYHPEISIKPPRMGGDSAVEKGK